MTSITAQNSDLIEEKQSVKQFSQPNEQAQFISVAFFV